MATMKPMSEQTQKFAGSLSRARIACSLRVALVIALPCAAAVSCGGNAALDSGTDTSTNWLKQCSDTAQCDFGSSCSCGRCTVECVVDADCAGLSANAVCARAPSACGETRLCMPAGGLDELLQSLELGPTGPAENAATVSCSHLVENYTLGTPALCFGRELPECAPGASAFFDACGCGCTEAPGYPRACRDQCELAGDCERRRFQDLPDYAATLADWTRMFADSMAGAGEGVCSNGRRFLYTANGHTSEARFFTQGGTFLGLSTGTDSSSPGCWGKGYWPEPVRCEQATVTRVLNAGLGVQQEGQVLRLPWAEGPPQPPI